MIASCCYDPAQPAHLPRKEITRSADEFVSRIHVTRIFMVTP